jgi:hypothetical protein
MTVRVSVCWFKFVEHAPRLSRFLLVGDLKKHKQLSYGYLYLLGVDPVIKNTRADKRESYATTS